MSKYLKVSGLTDDYAGMYYEITEHDIDSLVEHAIDFGANGGSYQDVKVEMVEIDPAEFAKIEEAN